ncbi:hypothetical protein MKEN_01129100 [Mycena kentingensis (nom. inval.)]|nr:hypothetical protein MKEN_01129100 [Mycena kentingensis (nom. inval.)]
MLNKIGTTLKSTYAQITLNRITISFFLCSFILCFGQGLVQAFLYSLDSQSATLVTDIVRAAEIPVQNITFLEGSNRHYTLKMCDDIPHGQKRDPCMVVFRSSIVYSGNVTQVAEVATQKSDSVFKDLTNGFTITRWRDAQGEVSAVSFRSFAAEPVVLSKQCTQTLVYPQQVLQNSVREDLTFIFLQFWLFGVSVFGVAQNSVPHLLTALGTRFLITSWSSYIVIFRTRNQESIFQQMIAAPNTPCGAELFPRFFSTRFVYDLADLVMSWTGLIFGALFSWYLLRLYNASSLKRVGAPSHINRIHKFFMATQACLQLEVFVLVAATSLWVDVLAGTAISKISAHTTIYNALIIATTILVLPWIALGWYSIRRESKAMMISFLAIAFFFVSGWALMFYSIVYRWSFVQWPYLGCFTVASFVLIIASVILGMICWRHFGQGLAEYLNAEAALASSNFAPEIFKNDDIEKSPADFYSYDDPAFPLPTFAPPKRIGVHSRDNSLNGGGNSMEKSTALRGPPPAYDRASIKPF